MRTFALRTHLVISFALMGLLSLGAGGAYWVRGRAHARIEQAFQEDLQRLSKLTRLQIILWRLDVDADRFILSGHGESLADYQELRGALKSLRADIAAQTRQAEELPLLRALDSALDALLAHQSQLLARRKQSGFTSAEIVSLSLERGSSAKAIEAILNLRDANRADLRDSRFAEARASLVTFFLVLATALLASGLAMFILLRNIIRPLAGLERQALEWRLGQPWVPRDGFASPEIKSLSATFQSMADRLGAQYEAEHRANQLKGQLVALVSHDFNNALAVIGGISIILEETGGTASREKREELYRILKSNVRALALECSTILNMGRLESGHFAVSPVKTTMATILRESLERLDILAQRKGLHVSLELPETPVPVKADPEALSLAITNLLSNAIKYTPDGGKIRLGLSRVKESRSAVIYVEDTGIGIKPEEKERIFSGYYRAEGGKALARGFGLGLSLAKNIIEAHGSALELTSSPGKGSRFFFRLPVWERDSHA